MKSKTRKLMTDPVRDEIVKLYLDGKSITEICPIVNFTTDTVWKALKKRNITLRGNHGHAGFHIEKKKELIIQMYGSGKSMGFIAKEVGFDDHKISRFLKKLGYEKRFSDRKCNVCLKPLAFFSTGNYGDYCKSHANKSPIRIAQTKEYLKNNLDKYKRHNLSPEKLAHRREKDRLFQKKRISTVMGQIHNRISCGIRGDLVRGKNGITWPKLLGYSSKDLKKHLESKFTRGMNWDAFMRGEIHIDHIIPKACFSFSSTEDDGFKKCWSLENLQPLWAHENMIKSSRLDWFPEIREAA